MKIKIYGITEKQTLNFLIENGVDHVRFIFHKNSENKDFHEVSDYISHMKGAIR